LREERGAREGAVSAFGEENDEQLNGSSTSYDTKRLESSDIDKMYSVAVQATSAARQP